MPPRARAGTRRGPRTIEQAADDVYRDMPPEEVRCRGAHHRFARDTVLPGQPWPSSVRAWPDTEGRLKIEEPCVDCQMAWRVTRTGVGGDLDAFAKSYIVYGDEWVSVPQGLDRRKRTIRQHGYERGKKGNQASLQAALDRAAADGESQVPQTRFAHASGA